MSKSKKFFSYLFLILAALISVFPLYWMISAATNTSLDITRGRLIPGVALFENIAHLTENYHVGAAMWNSFRYASVLTLLSLLICSLAGYGFEVYHTKGKDRVMNILLLAMMVPFVAIMIPLYQMCNRIGVMNSIWGFMLPTLSTPLLIMLFRQASRNFPYDIIEAARLDGVSELGIFFRIYMPGMKSTYAAGMTITFMNAWNSYLWPKVIMTDEVSLTMPMLVANLKEGYVTDYGALMLAVLMCTLPTAVIFLLLQKNFAAGVTGAVKQ